MTPERLVRSRWAAFCRSLEQYRDAHGAPIVLMFPGTCVYDQAELHAAMDQGRHPEVLFNLPLAERGVVFEGGDP